MRLIGHLDDERRARTFSEFLYAQDIENEVEPDGARWAVWVRAEEHLDGAARHLDDFRRQPDDRRYARAAREAREKRERKEEEQRTAERRYFERDQLFSERLYRLGAATAGLIILSLLASFSSGFGRGVLFSQWLAIAPFTQLGDVITFEAPASALQRWEVWRWFTPMFVHMDWLHLFFNLWWLKDLGGLVESRIGHWRYLALVLLISGPANAAQFILVSPAFGGMSGVIYGLFGYIWVRERLDPDAGMALDPFSRMILLAWFFLCLLGVMPNVANVVHAVGLGLGLMAGWMAAQGNQQRES